jgi:hypothetical protein
MPPRSTTASIRVGGGFARVADAADPQDPALCQEDRSQGDLVELELLTEIEYRAKSAKGKVRYPFQRGAGRPVEHGRRARRRQRPRPQ